MAEKFNLDNYVPVHERLEQFWEKYPEGHIVTQVVEANADSILIKAEVYRNSDEATQLVPAATGHAFEDRNSGYVNKTSHVENAETSAIGRALANLGFEIKKGIAIREEIQKVQRAEFRQSKETKPDRRAELLNTLSARLIDYNKTITDIEQDYGKSSEWTVDKIIEIGKKFPAKKATTSSKG